MFYIVSNKKGFKITSDCCHTILFNGTTIIKHSWCVVEHKSSSTNYNCPLHYRVKKLSMCEYKCKKTDTATCSDIYTLK